MATLRSGIPGAERIFLHARETAVRGSGARTWCMRPSGLGCGTERPTTTNSSTSTGGAGSPASPAGPVRTWVSPTTRWTGTAKPGRAPTTIPASRRRFERDTWPDWRDDLPERLPAYEALLALPGGGLWVKTFRWHAPGEELHLLDANGVWLRRLTFPRAAAVLDIGPDWVLLSQRHELDIPTVALYELVETDPAHPSHAPGHRVEDT